MNIVDYLSAKAVAPSSLCIYGAPLGAYAPPGKPEWLRAWDETVERALKTLQSQRRQGETVQTMALKLQTQGGKYSISGNFLLSHVNEIKFKRARWLFGGVEVPMDKAAASTWAFFEILRAFENSLKTKSDDPHFVWRAQLRLLAVSGLTQKYFTKGMLGYEHCMQSMLQLLTRRRISADCEPASLPPMAHYLIGAMTWGSKGKETQLAVKCLPGLEKAQEWLARVASPAKGTKNHFGPTHWAAVRGGAAESALQELNPTTEQLAGLFGALPEGGASMEPMDTYARLAAMEARRSRSSTKPRLMQTHSFTLNAEWRVGDSVNGEIAVSKIPDVALPASLLNLRAYICFKRGHEPDRLIPLDLSDEEWEENGGTLIFEYDVEDTKMAVAFDDDNAHIDENVLMMDDAESGETVIRIEVHSLV